MTIGEALPVDSAMASSHDSSEYGKSSISEPEISWLRRNRRVVTIASAFITLQIIVVALLLAYAGRMAPDVTVNLGYAKYRGAIQRNSNVKAWLGMRYAAAPTDDLRFAAPQDPPAADDLQDATRHGKFCIAVGDLPPINPQTSEDCLFIDVYASADATPESKLPVFFFIQGGGFAGNANANYNGAGLIEAADMDMVVVTFNYRVGAYGFLSGQNVPSSNNGLKDQRKALHWVHDHISKFGGNPDHIVIGGDSAGGASVAIHLTAYGGNDTGLFHAAAMESPSFATVLTNPQSQFLYDAFVNRTSCGGEEDTFKCLQKLPLDEVQKANQPYPYPGATGRPVYSWNPVVDGELLRDVTYGLFNQGNFVNVPTIVGDDTNGGTIFAPRNIASLEQSNEFLANTFPFINDTHIERLNELYPNNPNDTYAGSGLYWRRTANIYGEIRYMCPNLFLASAIVTHGKSNSTKVWNYRFNVQDPTQVSRGLGVPHVAEVGAIWGPENVDNDPVPPSYRSGGSNAAIVPMMQGYWTSFIRSFDPNTHRSDGTPEWKIWSGEIVAGAQSVQLKGAEHDRMLFDSPVVNSKMEIVDNGLWSRCEYIWSIALDLRQ